MAEVATWNAMTRRNFMKGAALALAGLTLGRPAGAAAGNGQKPNIIFVLADDIGYGDLGCYGATKVKTPNVDRLAREGVRFTDAHAPAAVCTPTRYALMTGQYAWRNPAGAGILSGEAPLAIDPQTVTVPALLKRAGYATGLVGKWHLGLGKGDLDYNREIKPGPLEVGFDSAFFIPATGDRVPCVFVENHKVAGLDPADPIQVSYKGPVGNEPTGREHPELLTMKYSHGHDSTIVNGISRIGSMSGGKAARWTDTEIADTLAKRAVGFIEEHKAGPFFLYLATHDIHVPRVPHARFKGKSGCGIRGDVIQEFDDTLGQVLSALDRLGLAENTLVIMSSDNGGVMDDGYADGAIEDANGHLCNGPLRGYKGSLWEGGHREPFIARWPGKIKAGTTCDETICLVDMLATFAALTGEALPEAAGPDSFNVLPALLGEAHDKPLRDHLVLQAGGVSNLAIRKGPWKLIPGAGGAAGGAGKGKAGKWKKKAAGAPAQANAQGKAEQKGQYGTPGGLQLYNLAEDLGEQNNLAEKHPEIVKELGALLKQVREKGRSRI